MKTSAFIFYLIIIGVTSSAISLCFGQINMQATSDSDLASVTTGWYLQVAFIGNVLLTTASVLCLRNYSKFFPTILKIYYFLMLGLIFIASAKDVGKFIKTPTLFYSPKGIGTWINFGILFFMADVKFSLRLLVFFKRLCYFFIFFNVARIAILHVITARTQALAAVQNTTVFLIWVYPFFFLDGTDTKVIDKVIKYASILVIAFSAFAISSRSYVFVIGIIVLIKFFRDIKGVKNIAQIFAVTAGGLIVGLIVFANISNFKIFDALGKIFLGRVNDDSRSNQIKEFMSQYHWDKLFSGYGPSASWQWTGFRHQGYEWLDNQFILVAWWFGIQTMIVYFLYLIYTLLKGNKGHDLNITNGKITIFFWILACAGFGIYITISCNLFYYFLSLLIGLICVKPFSERVLAGYGKKLFYVDTTVPNDGEK